MSEMSDKLFMKYICTSFRSGDTISGGIQMRALCHLSENHL